MQINFLVGKFDVVVFKVVHHNYFYLVQKEVEH